MKTNPIRLLFAAAAAAALFCQSVSATMYLQDEFQYNASGRLGDPGTGSTWVPPWKTPQNGITLTNGSHSLDGTGLGLVQSYGDKVNCLGLTNGAVAGVQNGCYNLWGTNGMVDPHTTNSVYTSFLYQFKNGFDLTNGNIIAQMNYVAGGIQSSAGATAYWQLIGRWTGSKVQLGIAKNIYNTTGLPAGANSGVTNWDATLVSPARLSLWW